MKTATHQSFITPLIAAVKARSLPLCKLLLEHGADINLKNSVGETPLMYAVTPPGSAHPGMIRFLVEAGADIDVHVHGQSLKDVMKAHGLHNELLLLDDLQSGIMNQALLTLVVLFLPLALWEYSGSKKDSILARCCSGGVFGKKRQRRSGRPKKGRRK